MIRWLGLWRPVAGRARVDWAFLFAVWLLVVSAITLLTAGSLYSETVEGGGVRRALIEAAPGERGVAVRMSTNPSELAELDADVRGTLEAAFGQNGAEIALLLRSPALRPALADGEAVAPPSEASLLVIGAYEGLAEHAELVQGRWPQTGALPVEVALHAGAAEALGGVAAGDSLALADASSASADPRSVLIEVQVVGLYSTNRQDAYWLGRQLELSGTEQRDRAPLVGPLMVTREDLTERGSFARLEAEWRAIPRVEQLRPQTIDALRGRIDDLQRAVEERLPDQRFVTVERELSSVLGRIDRSALASRSGVLLTTLQFGGLGGYAVLLVGGILAERRRPEVALLRARGASSAEVGLIAAGEAAVLSVPAALAAPWLALLVVEAVGGWGSLGESGIVAGAQVSLATWLVALAGGAACLVALTVPALLAEVDLARVRAALGRPLAHTAAQRLGLDVVLLVVAVIGLLQLSAYGGTLTGAGRQLELDPLLVAAPAIALAAGAVLVVRLVPRVGELAEWLLGRGRGLTLPYSARQTARRPLRYTRVALLIVLAVALGTFAALYSATWTRSQVDQAAHQAGADLRVSRAQQASASPAEMAATLAALPGVELIAPLSRGRLDAGRAVPSTTLLAVEPEALLATSQAAGARAADWQAALETLLAARRPPERLALPPGTRWLALVIDADLRSAVPSLGGPEVPFNPARWPGIRVAPIVASADGPPSKLAGQSTVYAGEAQRLEFELPSAEEDGLQLSGIELELGAPGETLGEVRLAALETASEAGDWQRLADPAALTEWAFTFQQLGEASFLQPVRIAVGDRFEGPTIQGDERHPLPACGSWSTDEGCTGQPHVYRWGPTATERLAAIGSGSLLRATGTAVGETISAHAGTDVELQFVAGLTSFPSLDPAAPFAIVDLTGLNERRAARGLNPLEANEWWLAVETAHLADVAEGALQPPIEAQSVLSRAELTRTLQRDPIALGMVGALLLGSLLAAGFAAVALLVGAVVSAREQIGELALMRALGVSRRQVVGLLAIEHGFLLGLGVAAGTGLGLVVSLLVLPHAPLNRAGEPVVPAPQIVLPWELLGLVLLAATILLVLSVLIASREISRRLTVDVLREREG